MQDRPSRIEIVLSACVFPGVGQFLQRRWIAAALYLSVGLVFAFVWIGFVCIALYAYLAMIPEITNLSPNEAFPKVRPVHIVGSLGAFLVVYVLNILDAAAAYRGRLLAWQRMQRSTPPPLP